MSEPKVPSPEEVAEQSCLPERRAWVRSPSNQEVSCHPRTAQSGVFWPAKVHDVSAAGLALVLGHRVDPGTLLDVTLEIDADTRSRTLRVRVIHVALVTAHPGLRWLAGCAFTRAPSELELRAFLS